MLIPMYFLIGIWGGPNRIYAAVKFFLYTIAGSLLMLVAILFVFNTHQDMTGVSSFNLFDLYQTQFPANQKFLLFLAFFVAFAIKVPLFPFHTWLPDAHTEAPTAGSVILAGVLLKMGTYAMLRIAIPLFPDTAQQAAPVIIILALIGIVYGALVAMVQPDVKKLVAYSSVSHLGFVVLGIFVFNQHGLHGASIQMVNHGLSTGALFLLVGMLYERRHTRMISEFGGIAKQMPIYFFLFLIVLLSSIGLPLLNGFVGEYLVLLGAYQANLWYAIVGTSGIIWGAVYMLWMFQRMMFGPLDKPENKELKDLDRREIAILVPIILVMFWIGIYSNPFLRRMDTAVNQTIERVQQPQVAGTK
jgi:NADH-quinone oxidoreductase subunit M